jgi:hypothetical protein
MLGFALLVGISTDRFAAGLVIYGKRLLPTLSLAELDSLFDLYADNQRRNSMKPLRLIWIVLIGILLAPSAGLAQISCSREGLQRAVNLYIAAQKGYMDSMPLAKDLVYMENMAPANINDGLIKSR